MTDASGIVQRCPWFEGVPPKGLAQLTEAAKFKSCPVGSCLYSIGDASNSIFCVLDGRIRLSITSALGHEFTIIDLEPESWLGEQCLIGNEPRLITAQVKEGANYLAIPRSVVLKVGEEYPIMYRNLFKVEILNARGIYQLMGGMLFYPLRARLAGRLIILLEEHGQVLEDGIMLDTRLSQNDFAHLVMGSRQRVNKIFMEWRERGILSMVGDNYLVTDIENLKLEIDIERD